jgi:hypothetical protein
MRITKSKSFCSCCNAKTDQIVELAKHPAKESSDKNKGHKLSVLVYVLSLVSSFFKQKVPDSSTEVKEQKKKGKNKGIIMGVKEFVDQVYTETEYET